jgi:hypothetical protein
MPLTVTVSVSVVTFSHNFCFIRTNLKSFAEGDGTLLLLYNNLSESYKLRSY